MPKKSSHRNPIRIYLSQKIPWNWKSRMKVAIVHDYLNQKGGAERVVGVLHEMFPKAPIFTSIVDHDSLWPELAEADIRASWMQKLPGWKNHFKKFLLLYPKAIESFDLRGYNLVISSSSAFAKGAIKGQNAVHVCYCYTPMRFVWDYENYIEKERLSFVYRGILPLAIDRLRKWDVSTSSRPDRYIAISSVVQSRIRRVYGREAEIIFPPVEVHKFHQNEHPDNFFLIVSRLAAYKRIDLAIRAFNILGLPLKIIGSGPALKSLQSLAAPNVHFLGRIGDKELADYYANCKALVFPGVEDFGIAPLEANAAGRPVIAFQGGGALDTVLPGINGLFFTEPSAESLAEAVRAFESGRFNFQPEKIREHALRFDKAIFVNEFSTFLNGLPLPERIDFSEPSKN